MWGETTTLGYFYNAVSCLLSPGEEVGASVGCTTTLGYFSNAVSCLLSPGGEVGASVGGAASGDKPSPWQAAMAPNSLETGTQVSNNNNLNNNNNNNEQGGVAPAEAMTRERHQFGCLVIITPNNVESFCVYNNFLMTTVVPTDGPTYKSLLEFVKENG